MLPDTCLRFSSGCERNIEAGLAWRRLGSEFQGSESDFAACFGGDLLHVYYALSVDYFLQFSVQRLCLTVCTLLRPGRRTNDEIRRHQEISLGMVRDQNDLRLHPMSLFATECPVFHAAWILQQSGFPLPEAPAHQLNADRQSRFNQSRPIPCCERHYRLCSADVWISA